MMRGRAELKTCLERDVKTFLNRCIAVFVLLCLISTQSFAALPHNDAALTVEQLHQRYPGAALHAVTAAVFKQAQREYAGHSLLLVDAQAAQTSVPAITPTSTPPPCPPGTVIRIRQATNRPLNPESGREKQEIECVPAPVEYEPPPFNVNILGELRGGVRGGNGDGAQILYVVIGLVVVAVLVVYSFKYAYDIVMHKRQYTHWWDLGFQSTIVLGNHAIDRGSLAALRFAGGIIDDAMRVGLTSELGIMDVDLRDDSATVIHTRATYGMLGPAVRWIIASTSNPSFVYLEVLGGTANNTRIGVLSTARAGISVGINEHARFGFNVGSMYTDMKETEGLLGNNTYNTTYSVELGYRF